MVVSVEWPWLKIPTKLLTVLWGGSETVTVLQFGILTVEKEVSTEVTRQASSGVLSHTLTFLACGVFSLSTEKSWERNGSR